MSLKDKNLNSISNSDFLFPFSAYLRISWEWEKLSNLCSLLLLKIFKCEKWCVCSFISCIAGEAVAERKEHRKVIGKMRLHCGLGLRALGSSIVPSPGPAVYLALFLCWSYRSEQNKPQSARCLPEAWKAGRGRCRPGAKGGEWKSQGSKKEFSPGPSASEGSGSQVWGNGSVVRPSLGPPTSGALETALKGRRGAWEGGMSGPGGRTQQRCRESKAAGGPKLSPPSLLPQGRRYLAGTVSELLLQCCPKHTYTLLLLACFCPADWNLNLNLPILL